MRVSVMQPYFFPYLGYFQLISASDVFVLYDDDFFKKGGWINRNYIIEKEGRQRITLEVIGGSPNNRINEVFLGNNQRKILKTLDQAYSKAPYFEEVFPLVEKILSQDEYNLARFLEVSLKDISSFIGINNTWLRSSIIEKEERLDYQEKIIRMCQELGGKQYINSVNGKDLYDEKVFSDNKIDLRFMEANLPRYSQFGREHISYLSIIDVLMFNGPKKTSDYLKLGKLV